MASKVTVIGTGNFGSTVAFILAMRGSCHEVVLRGRNVDVAKGKALDMSQAANAAREHTIVRAAEKPEDIADSKVVVITAGAPRTPGMSRDDLISTNAGIVSSVTKSILKYTKNPIIIVVSNPLDVMTYAAFKSSGLKASRVFGMAGILDTARYRAFLADEIGVSPKDIQALLMGGHGDTMVPLPRYTTVGGIPVTQLIAEDKLEAIIQRTKVGGGELVKLMGTSAWYAPGSAAAQMVEAILKDQKRVFPVCAKLDGEYGIDDCYLGVPVILGRNGIEKFIEIDLDEKESADLQTSRGHVKEVMAVLDKLNS